MRVVGRALVTLLLGLPVVVTSAACERSASADWRNAETVPESASSLPAQPDTDDGYRRLAIEAINSYDGPNSRYPQVVAYDARARAELYGWDDPMVARAIRRLDAMRTPTGGWGVAGSPRTYTITTAEQVGQFVIEAYRHGLVDISWLVTIREVLLHRIPRVDGGRGIAYSTSPKDHPGRNVYNVTAAAALWLRRMMTYAPQAATAEARNAANRWAARIESSYSPEIGGWPYSDKAPPVRQDGSHNAPVAEMAAYLTRWRTGPARTQIEAGPMGMSARDYGNGVAWLLTIPALASYRESSYAHVRNGLRLFVSSPPSDLRTRGICQYAVHLAMIAGE